MVAVTATSDGAHWAAYSSASGDPRGELGAGQGTGGGAHDQVRGGQVEPPGGQPGDQAHLPGRAGDAAAAEYQCFARHAAAPYRRTSRDR